MDGIKVKAKAKINLCLDVTGRADGYHLIDSVVTTVDIADIIRVKKRKKDKLVNITMRGLGSESVPFENNNAVAAAERFIERYDTCGVDIAIDKNIPMGAGLGGSSADAAGTLNAMKRLFGVDDEEGVKSIADAIGSDCGYMLYGGYARISGRGDIVKPLESKLKLYIALLIPRGGVSTAQCYALYDKTPNGGRRYADLMEERVLCCDAAGVGSLLSNDLYAPARLINADVEKALLQLKAFAPLGVNMTGSGSAVYALFENDQFLNYAASRYRGGYNIILTKTV